MTTLLASGAELYSEPKGLDSKAASSRGLKHPHDGDRWQLVDLVNITETPTTVNAPKYKENAEDPKQETKDDLKLRVKEFASLKEQKPLDLATTFDSGFAFGGLALNNCERGLLWVDERDTQRKKGLPLTPWKEYHQQRLKKEHRERPPSPFSNTCILFILSFWFVRLSDDRHGDLTWILWNYLVPSAIMYACLQPFENRHGGKKAALLTLGVLGASAILSLSYNPHQSVLDPTSLAFASLGLAHADLCVNWDLLMLGQTGSHSMCSFLWIVSIDLILLPYLLAYERRPSLAKKFVLLVWWPTCVDSA